MRFISKNVLLPVMIITLVITIVACGNQKGNENVSEASSAMSSINDETIISESAEKEATAVLSSFEASTTEIEVSNALISSESTTSTTATNEVSVESSQDSMANEIEVTENPLAKYGRILFIGDSRTVDIFSDSAEEISGVEADGITVYARNGAGDAYMTEVLDNCGMDSFDTLVTWMGANDWGDYAPYVDKYGAVLEQGKNLIVCTVGPSDNNSLHEDDKPYYCEETIQSFNNMLTEWAANNNVKVVDLYTYVKDNVTIDPADGIHYAPRPTPNIWTYMVGNL